MIKINLLPKTINEKAAIRNTAIIFGVIFIAIIVAGFVVKSKLAATTQEVQAQTDAAKIIEARVKDLQAKASDEKNSIQPIDQKLKFITDVLKYNQEYPKLYAEVAKWTYDKVSYSSLSCDGTQVIMNARVKSLDDLGRFLLNMYRATDLFTSVTISAIPGYGASNSNGSPAAGGASAPSFEPAGQMPGSMAPLAGLNAISSSMEKSEKKSGIAFTVTCKLKTPIVAPALGGGGASSGVSGGTAPNQ